MDKRTASSKNCKGKRMRSMHGRSTAMLWGEQPTEYKKTKTRDALDGRLLVGHGLELELQSRLCGSAVLLRTALDSSSPQPTPEPTITSSSINATKAHAILRLTAAAQPSATHGMAPSTGSPTPSFSLDGLNPTSESSWLTPRLARRRTQAFS